MSNNINIVFFDGVCNLCNYFVDWLIKKDKKRIYNFASLQSETGKNILKKINHQYGDYKTMILYSNQKIYTKSSAALRIISSLGGFYKVFKFLLVIPAPIRDFCYSVIAANRYKWFGKRSTCRVPTTEERSLFLTDDTLNELSLL